MSTGILRLIVSGLIALTLGFAINATRMILMGHAQSSWCASNCQMGVPTPEMQRLTKEQADRRARFEEGWGGLTSSYNDQTLERIEKNSSDPDCWQYTPKHC
jgi:hypothetical protein